LPGQPAFTVTPLRTDATGWPRPFSSNAQPTVEQGPLPDGKPRDDDDTLVGTRRIPAPVIRSAVVTALEEEG